ncbi:MAG: T9SS type A sorting domain-containing protein [Polaribacter sp.]|mgnify:CR=1 FL=1|nr:T9SS type A sorting domain-containing protein [Polaribacter sp.]MDG1810394.1 T9SS type A sorting domain-containing protein [Polaribacter sp.]MDG1994313.1 T9SS type A sorting domain-containing protein [Polaribacter sp.]
MKHLKTLSVFFILFCSPLASQNQLGVKITGIKENDSIRVIVQKSSEIFIKKWIHYNDSSTTSSKTFDLSTGKWAVKLDATGYTYPSQQVINIPTDKSIEFTLTELTNSDYDYTWEDDGSDAGHATQRYVNEPPKIVVLNDSIAVPNDFSSIKLRTEYGVILSDSIQPWSKEDSYRLYKMFSNLPYRKYGEANGIDLSSGKNIRGIFMLTNDEQSDDLTINNSEAVPYATVSQNAFTYAEPQIVTIDGIKGKFFSKRLYHVVVRFITDFANNENVLNWLAAERFGVKFMKPNQETEDIMSEDASNFQEFYKTEKLEILAMLEELPEGFHKQEGLKYLVRRIDGQDNPTMPPAAAIAWSGLHVIEFMSKAFNGGSINDHRRLILHEKAHFLWAYTFDQQLKDDWADLGGWFKDPTAASGWSTTNTTEAVSAYAHLKNPNEDMAESIAFYLTNPNALRSVSVRKYEFVRDRVMHGTRYIAQIREDLTFIVYNLFPDYTFPGKITKIELDVKGKSEEDKEVTIRATLNSTDPKIDGANGAELRFASSTGSIHDLALYPENGQEQDSVLIGTTTFSKLEKSGYWSLASFKVTDPTGNMRYENTSTVGMKLYIENPLEDILAPAYNYDYSYEIVTDKFTTGDVSGTLDENGEEMRALKISFSHYDESPSSRGYARLKVPNENDEEVYERDIQGPVIVNENRNMDNGFNSNKNFEMYLLLYDYLQSGYYSTTYSFVEDIAGNEGKVYHVKDTADYIIPELRKLKEFKEVRDSIYIETLYPDSLKPEIDLNNITITAEPTNPSAPDGETRVNITLIARDLSNFAGHEAGISGVSFTLRDPLGGIHGYQSGNATMNHPGFDTGNQLPENNSNWKTYNFNLLLPKGSPPGQWGMASARVEDKAGNWKNYSFVEYVRFDIIKSDVQLTKPLDIEITDKVVNALNVSNISAVMECKPCKDKNYVYTIYSLMGGTVVRGEGVFENDSIVVNSINTQGVLEGVIKLTVQVTDSESRLIATKTTDYIKDTVLPKSYYSQSNLQNDGKSSLDDFVIDVVIETIDVGGEFDLNIEKTTAAKSKTNNSINLTGSLTSETTKLSNLKLTSLSDGIYKFSLTVIDPNGNPGAPEIIYYKKTGNEITKIGKSLSLETLDFNTYFSLYPNPTADILKIKQRENLIIKSVSVSDLNGREILTKKSNRLQTLFTLDVSALKTGIYILNLKAGEENLNVKFIKK